ncbi:MAG: DUF6765 family protein [Spirochaetia bacterium]
MNTLFHYYTVHYLAEQAGFSAEDAAVISYSSQYLDNALVRYAVETDDGVYETVATHHFGFWDKSREWSVWIPFHFFPAGPEGNSSEKRVDQGGSTGPVATRRVDGETNPLNVVANSGRVKRLLLDALRSRDLYQVGIALHTYADSWAHQNFSGKSEDWNRLEPSSPLPPIGHAQKLRDPDQIDSVWKDSRIAGSQRTIDSRKRILDAAGRVYRYLATYNGRSFADEELVLGNLERLFGPPGRKGTEERVADFVIECSMAEYRRTQWRQEAFTGEGANLDPGFGNGEMESTMDKLLWLKDELLHKTEILKRQPVKVKPGFYSSNLYKWDQAARAQLTSARAILADLLPAEESDV